MRRLLLVLPVVATLAAGYPASASYHTHVAASPADAGVVQRQWVPEINSPGTVMPISTASYTLVWRAQAGGYVLALRCGAFSDSKLNDYVPLSTTVTCSIGSQTETRTLAGAASETAVVTATELPATICTRADSVFASTSGSGTLVTDYDYCHTFENF